MTPHRLKRHFQLLTRRLFWLLKTVEIAIGGHDAPTGGSAHPIPIRKRAVWTLYSPNSGFSWSLRISLRMPSVVLRTPLLVFGFASKPRAPSSVHRWSVL